MNFQLIQKQNKKKIIKVRKKFLHKQLSVGLVIIFN